MLPQWLETWKSQNAANAVNRTDLEANILVKPNDDQNNFEANYENNTVNKCEQNDRSWITASFSTFVFVGLILISLVLGRQYVEDILLYIDSLEIWESTVLFAVMFTVVAFPIMWGYVLLNIAAGYTYGFLGGTAMTAGCATYAMLCAHFVVRRFFKTHVEKTYIINEQTKALMNIVSGKDGYKIVFLARFTPIPFGLQNAIFAVSSISVISYLMSSVCGLIVTQGVYAYMGSTVRSMTEVFSSENSLTTWILLISQIMITIGLTIFIVHLARKELQNRTVPVGPDKEASDCPTSNTCSDNDDSHKQQRKSQTHSRNMSVNIPPIYPSGNLLKS